MKEYRAGIYLRLSREHSEENNSIEAQREITTNYAMKNNYRIVKEYADNGYSGILDSRPALNEMMLDISRGFINMVIVKDISRLTRDKNKTGWYTEIFFPDNDVRFISVTEFIDSGDRYEIDDTIMLRGIANQYYLTDISKNIEVYQKNGVLYGPAKAANAGGVAVSGLEMSQNSYRLSWTFEEVDAKLKSIMEEIVANSLAAAKEYGHEGDLMLGANAAGFVKVANAMVAQGVL